MFVPQSFAPAQAPDAVIGGEQPPDVLPHGGEHLLDAYNSRVGPPDHGADELPAVGPGVFSAQPRQNGIPF